MSAIESLTILLPRPPRPLPKDDRRSRQRVG
jgi:hypothetical protein